MNDLNGSRRIVKWLILGLEVPLLSLIGILLGLRLSGDRLDLSGFVGMMVGGTMGLVAGSLILYLIASRTYSKDKRILRDESSSRFERGPNGYYK